jgi:hypothetical protein
MLRPYAVRCQASGAGVLAGPSQGRVVHRDGGLAFLEASLFDSKGALIATATATARVIALDRAGSAA